MTRLNGENGASSCQVVLAHDVGCCAEIGTDTNALEDGSGGKEGLDVVQGEVIGALLDGGCVGSFERRSQETDMGALILGDGLNSGARFAESSISESGLVKLVESLLVEIVFKMLERQGIVEDIRISDFRSCLTESKQAV